MEAFEKEDVLKDMEIKGPQAVLKVTINTLIWKRTYII